MNSLYLHTQFKIFKVADKLIFKRCSAFQINDVTNAHLRRLLTSSQEEEDLWACIADQGDLKVFKRELEENGIVIDPVKAVCTIKVGYY